MYTDNQHLQLSTTNTEAAEHYCQALADYFEYRLSAGKSAKAAVAADPQFVLGHCLRGYFNMLIGSKAFYDGAREHLELAKRGVADVTHREQQHVLALETWLGGDVRRCCQLWAEIVIEHPHDLLALRLHHFASFWRGRQWDLRALPAQVLSAWDENMPGYGNVLGMLAFGHEECGDFNDAETLGREAVSLNPDDLWALHAVAHVLEMQGRLEEGINWLNHPADHWRDRNPFRGHLWWHRALYSHELGDYDQVLELYDRSIRVEKNAFYLDIQNQASLLMRLEFQGVDIGQRWVELADYLETKLDDHVLSFTDIHTMMALAAEDRQKAMLEFIETLDSSAEQSTPDQCAVTRAATIPMCHAVAAFRRGEYASTLEILDNIEPPFSVVGASHAQRDIFDQIRLEAAIGASQLQLALRLLSERTTLKPHSYGNWHKLAVVRESLGNTQASADAHHQAQQILANV